MILGHLSDAVLAQRSLQASHSTSLPLLWQLVRGGAAGSAFRQRYNAILFHDRMKDLGGGDAVAQAMGRPTDRQGLREMRKMQERGKFWRDICDLRPE